MVRLRAGIGGVCRPYLDSGKDRHRGGQLHPCHRHPHGGGAADELGHGVPYWLFLVLSGLATGASWLCYYHALQVGAASKVVPIDKLSVVITLALAFVVLHEPFTAKSLIGCALITAGTLFMVL